MTDAARNRNDAPPPVERTPDDPVLKAVIKPGCIEYKNLKGETEKFWFQCNPTSLTRSRTVTRVDSKAGNPAEGTTDKRGLAGRKFTHKASPWRFDSLELWFDASMPHWPSDSNRETDPRHTDALKAIDKALAHVEAISEPGPASTESESPYGQPPAPSPPRVTLTLGRRIWQGYVTSVSILEKDFTNDLVPRQVKVTLGLDMIPTQRDLELGKTGGEK